MTKVAIETEKIYYLNWEMETRKIFSCTIGYYWFGLYFKVWKISSISSL